MRKDLRRRQDGPPEMLCEGLRGGKDYRPGTPAPGTKRASGNGNRGHGAEVCPGIHAEAAPRTA